jgi:hypothetical protein
MISEGEPGVDDVFLLKDGKKACASYTIYLVDRFRMIMLGA